MEIIVFDKIEEKIIELRGEKVILDSDVAELYGVETKRINEAVKNNPDRFPSGYIIETTSDELDYLRSKISTAKLSKTRTTPKAFTEKGLYMLATILTSKQAIATTIAIVEAFQKIKSLSRVIKQLPNAQTKQEQQSLMQKSGEIIADILDDALESDESETTIELNLAVLKFKHTIKKKKQ
ncbi:ORF6N domain-containing protein [Wolinella succinogenes]|uniref:ORF6N domain-containing protein n=1 Tax=Wolinella succinogenes TaxID=844 RepID=UPI002409C1F5|nr:ORF6N domain-containing protein [Wolinella succinogenes]